MGEFENGVLQGEPQKVYCFGQDDQGIQFEEILKKEGACFELRSLGKETVTIKPGDTRSVRTNIHIFKTRRGDNIVIFLDKELNTHLKLQPLNVDAFNEGILTIKHRKDALGGVNATGFSPIVIGEPSQTGPGISGVCEIKPNTVLGRVYRRKENIYYPS